MPREISIEMPFAMGAADFWALRMDRNFDVFCGACDPPRLRPHRYTDPPVARCLPYAPSHAAQPPRTSHASASHPCPSLPSTPRQDELPPGVERGDDRRRGSGVCAAAQPAAGELTREHRPRPSFPDPDHDPNPPQMKENPVPKSVRSMVGSGDDFSYRVHYRFHRDAFDEAHPFRYTTEFPVLSERIKVEGRQWLVPISPTACTFRAVVHLSILISGEG